MTTAFGAPGELAPADLLPADQAPASVFTQLWANRGLIFSDDTFYQARLTGGFAIQQSAIDAIAVGGRIATTTAPVGLNNDDRLLDSIIDLNAALGRKAAVKITPAPLPSASDAGGSPLSSAAVAFQGVVASFGPRGRAPQLQIGDFSEQLNVPLQQNLYDGSGGLGGPASLKGLPKPVSLGWRFNVTPVYLGSVDLGLGSFPTYQTHYREIRGHDAARVRGVSMALVENAPGLGQWADFPALGCFQLGFTPDGVVTCDVAGDAPGGDYAGTTSAVVQRLLTTLGPSVSLAQIDTASFDRVATKLNGEIGWGIDATVISAADALDAILAHCGVWMSGNRSGQARLAIAAPLWSSVNLTLDAYDIVSLQPVPLPASLTPTPQSVVITAAPNWTVLTDVAGSVSDSDRTRLTTTGSRQTAFSDAVGARMAVAKNLVFDGLYRFEMDALGRARDLMDWIARGLSAFQIETDHYLNQVELGHIAYVTYPFYGLDEGFAGVVVAYKEDPAGCRVTITIVG
jgi:hypothetical protein